MKFLMPKTSQRLETIQDVTVVTEAFLCQPFVLLALTARQIRNMRPTTCVHLVPIATVLDCHLIHSVHHVTQECTALEKVIV